MMKIDGIRPVRSIGAYEQTRRTGNVAKVPGMGSDKAEISSEGMSFAATLKALKGSMEPSVQRSSYLEDIENRINKGEYNIDSGLVADKMLSGLKLDKDV